MLDINEYRTIPIHIQYLKGSYGTVDLGATMALILMSIIPVIIFYLACPEIHHQGRCGRCCKRIKIGIDGRGRKPYNMSVHCVPLKASSGTGEIPYRR